MKATLKPIATLGAVLLMGAATTAFAERSGEEVYSSNCTACHDTGAAGAPKLGDAESWGDRLDKGKETLYENSINGIRAMPPMGTCSDCSEKEVKNAVDYMLSETL